MILRIRETTHTSLDMAAFAAGSSNFTFNSAERCDEIIFPVCDEHLVIKHANVVWQRWSASHAVDWEFIRQKENEKQEALEVRLAQLIEKRTQASQSQAPMDAPALADSYISFLADEHNRLLGEMKEIDEG